MIPEFQFGPLANEHPETFWASLLGLLLLLALLYRFALPGFRRMLNDRAVRIESDQTQVASQLEDIQRLRDDYAARIRQIEVEARERIDAAVREAENARTEIIAEAQQTALALRRRSEEEIARERTRQRILLRQQIVATTLDAAEHSVRANSSEALQRQLIQDFIGRAAAGNGSDGVRAANGNAGSGANLAANSASNAANLAVKTYDAPVAVASAGAATEAGPGAATAETPADAVPVFAQSQSQTQGGV